MDTCKIYGRMRNVLAVRMHKTSKTVCNREFYTSHFRLILDGGETYDGIYQPELSERYKRVTMPAAIEAQERGGDILRYPQGETFNSYGGLTTYDEQDIAYLNALSHTEPAKQKPKPQTDPGELERLRAFAKQGKPAAIKSLTDAFQDLSHEAIHVGWLHANKKTWKEIKQLTGFSQGKIHRLKNEFYTETGWPKGDRRKGGGIGKTYQLDENRDTGTL